VKALVTGGSGFIGSHLVDILLASGDEVVVLDRIPERYRQPMTEVDYRFGQFSDPFILAESLVDVDIVYHLASTTVPSTSNLDPAGDVQDNLVGTLRLLDQMMKSRVRRIVFLSSGGTVYGMPAKIPIPEDHMLRPLCSYGVVKVAIEDYLHMYQKLYGLSPVILRPSNPFGPRQGHLGVQGLIATLLYKALKGNPFVIWGDGSVVRDYLYIDDLVRLIRLAGCSDAEGTFNAGSGFGYSVNEVIAVIGEVMDVTPAVKYEAGRSFDIREVILDISKARVAFGWTPETSLRDGIRKQWLWMKANAQSLDDPRSPEKQ